MPDTITHLPDRNQEPVRLTPSNKGSQQAAELSSRQESNEPVKLKSYSAEVSRLFIGPWLSCLNLPLKVPRLRKIVEHLTGDPKANVAVNATYPALRNVFSDSSIRLEVYPDPEGERPPELALIVETEDDPDTALEKLDRFDERFWLDHVDQFGNLLSVHVEYQ